MEGEGKAEEIYKYYLKRFEKILGNKATSSEELTSLGKKIFGGKYIGTLPRDLINGNTFSNKKKYVIINNQTSDKGGEHWVASAYNDGTIYSYDSYGNNIFELIPELRQFNKVVNADRDAEQVGNQENCGARCMTWLYMFDRYGKEKALLI